MSRRWNAPAEVLRRLLDISSSLPIEEGSEVTPIQVWHMISQGPDYSRMKVAHLVWMSDRLLRQVKCYGYVSRARLSHIALRKEHGCRGRVGTDIRRFGAVVTQDYLKKMLTEMRV